MRKGESIFGGGGGAGGGSGFLEIAVINFTSGLLFDLLLTRRLKDVASIVIFPSRF